MTGPRGEYDRGGHGVCVVRNVPGEGTVDYRPTSPPSKTPDGKVR